jgi:hypothetical protein
MNDKDQKPVEQVRRLLNALGYNNFSLTPQQPPRPDVLAVIGPRQIFIEATDYHGDEKVTGGSSLRKQEQKDFASEQIKGYWPPVDPMPAIVRRITEKTSKRYDVIDADETWLAIFAGVPQLGATASTFMLSLALNTQQLTSKSVSLLDKSQFSRCYIFCNLTENGHPRLYSWHRGNSWNEVVLTEARSNSVSAPSVLDILKHFRK